uniref:Putative secreted protein n=1 Tax=Aedes aegypti TaxID=7159 RepID=Q8T9U9_AEDAE|nr:putative secreted protein [Aedes aegypti]
MNSVNRYVLCIALIALFVASFTTAEENCEISANELGKIEQTLTHINQPIYTGDDESEVSDSDQCAQMLRGIHFQLRRLTQKYKLMNKGYVKAEEFAKMARDYEDQLSVLKNDLEQSKIGADSSAKQKMQELKKDIATLEQNVNTLHKDLEGITDELGKVRMDLCLTYMESNQLSNAQDKVKTLAPKYLMELVEQFLNKSEKNWLPVVDLSVAIPDLDDRGQVYKTVHEFLKTKNRDGGEDSILLEAEVLKMNATFHPGSKITEDRKKEIQDLLEKLSLTSTKIFDQWTQDLAKLENSAVYKNSIDRMFLTQMEKFGERVMAKDDYYSLRNFLKLLVVSTNYYKIAAYRKLIQEKIGHTLAVLMFDMMSMERTELQYDPHVPDEVVRMYDESITALPDSLKNIRSCLKLVKIYNHVTNQCILATNEVEDVNNSNPKFKSNVLGRRKLVKTASNDCTPFRLEPSADKASIRIITPKGDALTNINSIQPGLSWFNRVGAPYTNNHNMKLDYSADWILDANYANDSIKIESEFNAYQTMKSVDHLMVTNVGKVPHVVVAQYGLKGMEYAGAGMKDAEWKFKCDN